jgi:predicted dehydrogenase
MSTMRFTNGAIALVNVNEKSPLPYNDFVFHGTKGRIIGKGLTRSRAGGVLEVTTLDGKTRSQEFPAINAHGACVAAFSQMLLDGIPVTPSGIDGLRSMQLTEAMAKSAWDGVHVRLAS